MKRAIFRNEQVNSSDYHARTPSYYLEKIEPAILESFTFEQIQSIISVLDLAIAKPSPKLVDLRIVVDLIFSRFYVVLFVGKDRRKKQRQYRLSGVAKIGNVIAAIILLIGMNLVLSTFIFLTAYLLKAAIGIDFFSDMHLKDVLKNLF